MAIFHHETKLISRKAGQSACACASYRAGEKIEDERYGKIHDYTNKQGNVYENILLPHDAPDWAKDRSKLWNAVEKKELRGDSQLAREINIALPVELTRDEQIKLITDYVKVNYVDKGMIADVAIHDKNDGNPHAHIMLTMRKIDKNGFKNKEREWNEHDLATEYRKNWAEAVNVELEKKGLSQRIDHRSNIERGIEAVPQIHVGVVATEIERKQILNGSEPHSERGDLNRAIIAFNATFGEEKTIDELDKNIEDLVRYKNEISTFEQQEKPPFYRPAELKIWEDEKNQLKNKEVELGLRVADTDTITVPTPARRGPKIESKPLKKSIQSEENAPEKMSPTTPEPAPTNIDNKQLDRKEILQNYINYQCSQSKVPPSKIDNTYIFYAKNGKNDNDIAKIMMIKHGIDQKDIGAAITKFSIDASKLSSEIPKYVKNIMSEINKEIAIHTKKVTGGGGMVTGRGGSGRDQGMKIDLSALLPRDVQYATLTAGLALDDELDLEGLTTEQRKAAIAEIDHDEQ